MLQACRSYRLLCDDLLHSRARESFLLFNGIGERKSLLDCLLAPFNLYPCIALSACSDVSKSPVSSHLGGLLDGGRGHVHAHQFKGLSLLGQGFSYVFVRLAYEVAHLTGPKHSRGVGLPHGGDRRVGAAHLGLEVLVANLLTEV